MHPRLVYLAMEIAELLNGNLIEANVAACVLRANFDIKFWCKVLAFRRGYIQNHLCKFGGHPHELLSENRPVYVKPMGTTTEDILFFEKERGSSHLYTSKQAAARGRTNMGLWGVL